MGRRSLPVWPQTLGRIPLPLPLHAGKNVAKQAKTAFLQWLRGHLKSSHIADKRKNFHMGGRGF